MKQNLAKNFFKEHRFIFQQGEGKKTAPTVAPTTAPPAAEATAEKPADPDAPAPTPGSPEAPKTPEAPAAAKETGTEKVEAKTESHLDREKLILEITKTGVSELIKLLSFGPKDISPKTTVSSLTETDLKTFINQMTAELEIEFNEKLKTEQDAVKRWLEKVGGGTQEEFVKFAAANQTERFKTKLENTLKEPAYQHLKAFAEDPKNKDKDLMYTVSFDKYGTPAKIEFGPTDLMTAYATFRADQEKLKTPTQKADEEAKTAADNKTRAELKTKVKSYTVLKFLAPFLELDKVDPTTSKDGWDSIVDGSNTIAMFALDLFGYEEGKGSIEGIASFVPSMATRLQATKKALSSEKNSFSAAAWQKKTGNQPAAPGAPQAPQAPSRPVGPGEVPTTNQQKINMTKFGEIIAKPDTMPKEGIVFGHAVRTGTGGIPQIIKIDLSKGGRLILPGNSGSDSELTIDGVKVVVPPGETRPFTKDSGKDNNGILILEGRINEGTVIDGSVKITNAALDTPR